MRKIKLNRFGNWNGYERGRKVREFGCGNAGEMAAAEWLSASRHAEMEVENMITTSLRIAAQEYAKEAKAFASDLQRRDRLNQLSTKVMSLAIDIENRGMTLALAVAKS